MGVVIALDGDRGAEFNRLARIYSWDEKLDVARTWPQRLLLRVMDIGMLEDILALERVFGHEILTKLLAAAEIGSLRPKSWTFWHYRLGLVAPGEPCPPMPSSQFR